MDFTRILTPENAKLLSDFLTSVLLLTITGIVASLASAVRQWFKAKFTNEQQKAIGNVASTAVLAAEQMGASGYIEDKKAQALSVVTSTLERAGIKVTAEQIESAIEAAVLVEINQPKLDAVAGVEAQVIAAEAAAAFEEPAPDTQPESALEAVRNG